MASSSSERQEWQLFGNCTVVGDAFPDNRVQLPIRVRLKARLARALEGSVLYILRDSTLHPFR
jgi:hypothetical protein